MIAFIQGSIVEKTHQQLTVDVAGIGYAVTVADEHIYQMHQSVKFYIYYHWNQENGPALYGFDNIAAKQVFAAILSCTGCGPKIGLAVLAHLSPSDFLSAIAGGQVHVLNQISGIGSKKAELMIMQLKDKVTKIIPDHQNKQEPFLKIKQLNEALTALRYKQTEITAAVEYVHTAIEVSSAPVEELLRSSLAFLSKRIERLS